MLHLEGGSVPVAHERDPVCTSCAGLTLVAANMTFFASLAASAAGADHRALSMLDRFSSRSFQLSRFWAKRSVRCGLAQLWWASWVSSSCRNHGAAKDQVYGPPWLFALPVIAAALYASMAVMTRALGVKSTAAALTIYNQLMFLAVSSIVLSCLSDKGRPIPARNRPACISCSAPGPGPQAIRTGRYFALTGVCNGIVAYCITCGLPDGTVSQHCTVRIYRTAAGNFLGLAVLCRMANTRNLGRAVA